MTSARRVRGLAGALVTSLALSSWCPPARGDSKAAAEALFTAGREARRRGEVGEACARFAESYRLDPAAGTRLNLAVCEAELGHLAKAWQHYVSLRDAFAPSDPRRRLVEERLRELDVSVPRVTFEAAEPLPDGFTLRVSDLAISASGFQVPIPLDPGEHALELSAPAHVTEHSKLTLAAGERRTLRIEALERFPPLVPSTLAARSAPSTEAPRTTALEEPGLQDAPRSSQDTWATLALGGGVASLVVGAIAGVGALEAKAQMKRGCTPDCTEEGLRAARRGEVYARVSTVGFAGGAVLLGVGATLVYLHRSAPASSPRRSVALRVSASGVALGADL